MILMDGVETCRVYWGDYNCERNKYSYLCAANCIDDDGDERLKYFIIQCDTMLRFAQVRSVIEGIVSSNKKNFITDITDDNENSHTVIVEDAYSAELSDVQKSSIRLAFSFCGPRTRASMRNAYVLDYEERKQQGAKLRFDFQCGLINRIRNEYIGGKEFTHEELCEALSQFISDVYSGKRTNVNARDFLEAKRLLRQGGYLTPSYE